VIIFKNVGYPAEVIMTILRKAEEDRRVNIRRLVRAASSAVLLSYDGEGSADVLYLWHSY
jgi:hypothetical protein